MNPFDLARYLIQESDRVCDIGELTRGFQRALEQLGFRYFACGGHVDPLHPQEAVMVLNYPKAWVEAYSDLQLHRVDPVFRYADRTRLPFSWSSSEFVASITPSQRRMLTLARRFGVANGYTIPIHGPEGSSVLASSCSLVPDSKSLSIDNCLAAQLMAHYVFDRAARLTGTDSVPLDISELSPRERQCLELVGSGKDDWTIARLLGLSEATVHNHIEAAKRRFRVTTRTQALVHALATRQINLADMMGPHSPSSQRGRRLQKTPSRKS